MKTKVYIGNLLRTLRKSNLLTQEEVASLLHISRQAYNRLECGYAQPTIEALAILSDIYDYDLFVFILKNMPKEMVAEQKEFKLNMPIKFIKLFSIPFKFIFSFSFFFQISKRFFNKMAISNYGIWFR